MPGQYYCTVQVNSKDETVVRFDPCRCVRPRYGFGHIPQFHSIVATMSTVLCNQVQECDEVYSGSISVLSKLIERFSSETKLL